MIKYKKYNFNLIEVALAMAILAIGIASILVLFPVGVNANKSAIANNNLADIAEYMMGYLRGKITVSWAKTSASNMDSDNNNEFRNDLQEPYSNLGIGNDSFPIDIATIDDPGSKWARVDKNLNNNDIPARLYQHKDNKQIFLFQQLSKVGDGNKDYVADFSAIVKVWKDDNFDFPVCNILYNTNKYKYIPIKDITGSGLKNYMTALCMEFSWPAEARYENREKRVFRFEVFNEFFKNITDTDKYNPGS